MIIDCKVTPIAKIVVLTDISFSSKRKYSFMIRAINRIYKYCPYKSREFCMWIYI